MNYKVLAATNTYSVFFYENYYEIHLSNKFKKTMNECQPLFCKF